MVMSRELEKIRKNESLSHVAMYMQHELYETGSWLSKPVHTVTDLFSCFSDTQSLRVLDLGCGVGRNSIAIAQHFKSTNCTVDCVDILPVAIDKLIHNANRFDVSDHINGILASIEEYQITRNTYDWILAISALEHVDSSESFYKKLREIHDGIRDQGIICLVINSNIQEFRKYDGVPSPAQFEVNLSSDQLLTILKNIFENWMILKEQIQHQQYDIPRGTELHELRTDVVTFVAARK